MPSGGGWVPKTRLALHGKLAIRMLAGGFIITSLLWASTLAAIIDRRLRAAGGFLAVAAVASLFGVIHSPLPGSAMFLPWNMPELPAAAAGQTPVHLAIAYGLAAGLLLTWGHFRRASGQGSEVSRQGAPPR
jgi:AGZA family xanthine/uracil permease-like MFS transporter